MTHQPFSSRRRQVMVAGALAAPMIAMAAHEPGVAFAGIKMVVSGRIVNSLNGAALEGARIEIWQADAHGARNEASRVEATTDGDGRYFAMLTAARWSRLQYRFTHAGFTTVLTQMHAGVAQRALTLTRDDHGAARVAFELALTPRHAMASLVPQEIVL